jgi:sugar phosphate isomerase/epimerase
MTWDRWDDAMDDVSDEETRIEARIRELKRRLGARGLTVPPFVPAPDRPAVDPDAMYSNYRREVRTLADYRDKLEQILFAADHESDGPVASAGQIRDPIEDAVLEALVDASGLTITELESETGLPAAEIRRADYALVAEGTLAGDRTPGSMSSAAVNTTAPEDEAN